MPAPYKRGQRLIYSNPQTGQDEAVTYQKWWGFERSALIMVTRDSDRDKLGYPGCCRFTVHVNDVKPV